LWNHHPQFFFLQLINVFLLCLCVFWGSWRSSQESKPWPSILFFFFVKRVVKKWYFWIKFITIIVSLLFSNWKAQLDLACLWKESCQKKKNQNILWQKKNLQNKTMEKKKFWRIRKKFLKFWKWLNSTMSLSKFLRSRFAKLWGIWLSKNQTKNHQGIV